MSFRLWVHDTIGIKNEITNWEIPPSDLFKTFSLKFTATETNAIRIHLHCKSGSGKIEIKEVKVVRLRS
jgi:hypothetical protein